MHIAILSDIHGNLPALMAVVEDMKHRRVDAVVNLGDSLSGPLFPLETARFLMAQDWINLAGNHERQLITLDSRHRGLSDEYAYSQLGEEEFKWIHTLKSWYRFNAEVILCHGTIDSDIEYFLETVEPKCFRAASQDEIETRLGKVSADLIACGHTHVPRVARTTSGQLIVNPGSVGLPAFSDIHPHPHTVETGSSDARYAIAERRNDVWTCVHIAVPYDHQNMAALALSRGRSDWAAALSNGRM